MTNKPQWYLIASAQIPSDLNILSEDDETNKDYRGRIAEVFDQTLTPLGEDLSKAEVVVPSGTKFAGILWGDGEHFDNESAPTWGILGEIEYIGPYDFRIRGVDGDIVADYQGVISDEIEMPHIMPPEAFGLKRQPWWNDHFLWCNS